VRKVTTGFLDDCRCYGNQPCQECTYY